jgi:hypothetical protein
VLGEFVRFQRGWLVVGKTESRPGQYYLPHSLEKFQCLNQSVWVLYISALLHTAQVLERKLSGYGCPELYI